MEGPGGFCEQAPPIYESFLKVILDHAVGQQILGPTKNPCPTFFTSSTTRDVWNKLNWGNYPQDNDVVKLPLKPVKRLIAIGDFHGDIQKTREALEIAKLLGHGDRWCGGKTVLVQVGDVLDRGVDEIKICYLLEKLRRGAYRSGGAVHVLHGNHETENVWGKYRYVLKDGFREFYQWKIWYDLYNSMKGMVKGCSSIIDYEKGLPRLQMVQELAGANYDSQVSQGILARLMALRPGGPMAMQFLTKNPTVLIIGKSMFVHGGITYTQVQGGYKTLNGYNSEVNEWVKGNSGDSPPKIISPSSDGYAITWNRDLGLEAKKNIKCTDLYTIMYTMKLQRLVIGHTIQFRRLINSACNQHVIRIDVGMSKGCLNNPPQALEILDDEYYNVLSARGSMPLSEADELPLRKRPGPDDDGKTTTEDKGQKTPIDLHEKKEHKKHKKNHEQRKKSKNENIKDTMKDDSEDNDNKTSTSHAKKHRKHKKDKKQSKRSKKEDNGSTIKDVFGDDNEDNDK